MKIRGNKMGVRVIHLIAFVLFSTILLTNAACAIDKTNQFRNATPPYPVESVRKHHEGTAELKILVDPNGRATKATVIKSTGYPELDQAALQTVKTWHFIPATKNGKPIAGYTLQTIDFSLP